MSNELFENTKISSYLLWEFTRHDNALQIWLCSEDMACFMERSEIFSPKAIHDIVLLGWRDLSYIELVRHIAYRIYIHTGNDKAWDNWFAAEKLINNREWQTAIANIARYLAEHKDDRNGLAGIRSGDVLRYYGKGRQEGPLQQ